MLIILKYHQVRVDDDEDTKTLSSVRPTPSIFSVSSLLADSNRSKTTESNNNNNSKWQRSPSVSPPTSVNPNEKEEDEITPAELAAKPFFYPALTLDMLNKNRTMNAADYLLKGPQGLPQVPGLPPLPPTSLSAALQASSASPASSSANASANPGSAFFFPPSAAAMSAAFSSLAALQQKAAQAAAAQAAASEASKQQAGNPPPPPALQGPHGSGFPFPGPSTGNPELDQMIRLRLAAAQQQTGPLNAEFVPPTTISSSTTGDPHRAVPAPAPGRRLQLHEVRKDLLHAARAGGPRQAVPQRQEAVCLRDLQQDFRARGQPDPAQVKIKQQYMLSHASCKQ